MKKTRMPRIIIRRAGDAYQWDMFASNGRPVLRSARSYPTMAVAVRELHALNSKGVLGGAVIMARWTP